MAFSNAFVGSLDILDPSDKHRAILFTRPVQPARNPHGLGCQASNIFKVLQD
jgi:hypothetical protein